MKLIRIFGLVFGLHVFVISLLFILPACQTTPELAEVSDTSGGLLARSDEPLTEEAPSGELDSSYNAGLMDTTPAASQSERYAPTRPELDPVSDMSILQSLDVTMEPKVSTYVVKGGDNLWTIANIHGISLDELLEVNDITRDETIYEGDEINVPDRSDLFDGEDDLNKSIGVDESSLEYIVQTGDTLSGIAARSGVPLGNLKRDNGLMGDTIYAGQKLYLRGSYAMDLKDSAPQVNVSEEERELGRGETIHTVASGETPSGIATRYGMETLELMRKNHITDPTKLKVGQELIVDREDIDSSPSVLDSSQLNPEKIEEREPKPPEIKPVFELPPSLEELDMQEDEMEIPVVPLEADEG